MPDTMCCCYMHTRGHTRHFRTEHLRQRTPSLLFLNVVRNCDKLSSDAASHNSL